MTLFKSKKMLVKENLKLREIINHLRLDIALLKQEREIHEKLLIEATRAYERIEQLEKQCNCYLKKM